MTDRQAAQRETESVGKLQWYEYIFRIAMKPQRAVVLSIIVLLSIADIAGSFYLWRLWPTPHGKPTDMSQRTDPGSTTAHVASKDMRLQ